MYWNQNSGADHSWYDKFNKKESARKYHKYFRQRDTLIGIPKILEDKLKKEDKEEYNKLISKAEDVRNKIDIDSIIKTYPESAAITKE